MTSKNTGPKVRWSTQYIWDYRGAFSPKKVIIKEDKILEYFDEELDDWCVVPEVQTVDQRRSLFY